MFGYVRPLQGELKVRELESYRAAYCGLCHTIGRKYGFLARLTLNYDFTLLAMLFSPPLEELKCCRKRCLAHPLKSRACIVANEDLELAADESIILAWQKLRDDGQDKGFLRGLPARFAALCLRSAYRKAAAQRPAFDHTVTACLLQLQALELAQSDSLDRTADTFARILQAAAPPNDDPARSRALEQLLYHLGRWIYLVDAWDDLQDDRANHGYNPLDARFQGKPEDSSDYVQTTMTHSIKLAISAYQLVEFGDWNPIIENILYLGLPAVQDAVFSGRWRDMQKDTGR